MADEIDDDASEKREMIRFAAALVCMHGLLSRPASVLNAQSRAVLAVEQADRLLVELDCTPPTSGMHVSQLAEPEKPT